MTRLCMVVIGLAMACGKGDVPAGLASGFQPPGSGSVIAPPPAPAGFANRCLLGHQAVAQLAVCEPACNSGDAEACAVAAMLAGSRYRADLERAKTWLERACDGGIGHACAMLARAYEPGGPELWKWRQVKADPARSSAYHAKATAAYTRECDAGRGTACSRLGTLYHQGKHVARDRTRSAELFERAKRAWQTACDAGDGSSCGELAKVYALSISVPQDMARARPLAIRGCELAHAESCGHAAAWIQEDDLGKPIRGKEIESRALAYHRRGCDLGSPAECISAGIDHEVSRLERACALHDPFGCGVLAEAIEGTDPARAKKLFVECCALREPRCCTKINAELPQ